MSDNIVFNEMADYYDQYRPDYPEAIIRTIVERANLTSSSRVLEIGAGSGKATVRFLDYGFEILCVEPGKDLAEKGMTNTHGHNVQFAVSLFEECSLPAASFDAVFSAQAFHWVKKPDGYALCAHCLKLNGYFMPFWNIEIVGNSAIDRDVFDIISRYNAYTSVMKKDAYTERVKRISTEIESSGFFSKPDVVQFEWEQHFTAEQYFGYFMTGNLFIKNTNEQKQACYQELMELENKYSGIRRTFVSELYIAQKNT